MDYVLKGFQSQENFTQRADLGSVSHRNQA